jgi:hypothetical protein
VFTPDAVLRSGDRTPSVAKTITVGGTVVDLTGGTVKFQMAPASGGALAVDAAAVIVAPLEGTVRYDWAAGDASLAPGFYLGRFVVTLAGKTLTAPNDGWLVVHVTGVDSVDWSYSGDPEARPLDWVRFAIGDTDATKPVLSDAEITSLLTSEGSKWWAAVLGCEMGAATFTSRAIASKSVGDLSISYDNAQRAREWSERGARLAVLAARKTGVAPINTSGGSENRRLTSGQFDNA